MELPSDSATGSKPHPKRINNIIGAHNKRVQSRLSTSELSEPWHVRLAGIDSLQVLGNHIDHGKRHRITSTIHDNISIRSMYKF